MPEEKQYRHGTLYEKLQELETCTRSHKGRGIVHEAAQGNLDAVVGLNKSGKTVLAEFIQLCAERERISETIGLWDSIIRCMLKDGEKCAYPMELSYHSGMLQCKKGFNEGTPYHAIIDWFGQAFGIDPANDLAGEPLPWEPTWDPDQTDESEEKNV